MTSAAAANQALLPDLFKSLSANDERQQFGAWETIGGAASGYGSPACRGAFLSRGGTIKSRQSGGFARRGVVEGSAAS